MTVPVLAAASEAASRAALPHCRVPYLGNSLHATTGLTYPHDFPPPAENPKPAARSPSFKVTSLEQSREGCPRLLALGFLASFLPWH